MKSEKIKNKLEVDHNVSYVVKKIFELYSKGYGFQKIATYLDKKGIAPPSKYSNQKKQRTTWSPKSIRAILVNEVYIGNTVQNKCVSISYKIKKKKAKKESEYIRVVNTHEPIISKKTFQQVQEIIKSKKTTSSSKHDFLLNGLIFCHYCGRKSRVCFRGKEEKIAYIDCSLARGKDKKCLAYNYNYDKFEQRILNFIREICSRYADKNNLNIVYENYKNNYDSFLQKEEKKLQQIDIRIEKLTKKIDKIYYDKLNNVITRSDYIRYTKNFIEEREYLEQNKKELQQKINFFRSNNINNNKKDYKEQNRMIDEFLSLKKPSRKFLYELIDRIEICQNKKIYIYFTFSKLNSINKKSEDTQIS